MRWHASCLMQLQTYPPAVMAVLLCLGRQLSILSFCAHTGPVEYRHAYVDMSSVVVEATNVTQPGRTCRPAMGFSFAAGTTDGARA